MTKSGPPCGRLFLADLAEQKQYWTCSCTRGRQASRSRSPGRWGDFRHNSLTPLSTPVKSRDTGRTDPLAGRMNPGVEVLGAFMQSNSPETSRRPVFEQDWRDTRIVGRRHPCALKPQRILVPPRGIAEHFEGGLP
jgi:hypothetical protein